MLILDYLLFRKISNGKGLACGGSIFFLLLVCLSAFLINTQSTLAQTEEMIIVQAPDTSRFPEISLQFKLVSLQGDLNEDLKLSDLTVLENGQAVEPKTLSKEQQGVHFTLVINPGRQLDIRDANGISSYKKLQETLIDWSKSHSSFLSDRWSFVNHSGVEVRNSSDREFWAAALSAYQPDFRNLQPETSGLKNAIDLASEWIVPFGVDKALLYITPAPLPEQINTINELRSKASNAGIQINVWMVDDPFYLINDQGGVLMDLAENTGGNFLNFTGTEAIPNPETYLADLGIYYELSYRSSIIQTGTFPLSIEVMGTVGDVNSESSDFYIEVEPPNPILISPPAVITRRAVDGQPETFSPSDQRIEIMVEFPDGHTRPLSASRFYVDGEMIVENDSPPFNLFNWDLRSISSSGEHTIQVEVVDSLGLTAQTMLTPVQVEVIVPTAEGDFSYGQAGVILLSVLGVILFVVLIYWLIRRYWQSEKFGRFLPGRMVENDMSDPVPRKFTIDDKKIQALLIPLDNKPGQMDGTVQINQSRAKIGSDPLQANLLIEAPNIDGLHSLLLQQSGDFWITDMDSPMGTWVNYTKIGKQPVRIRPGDVVHFGTLGFRFTHIENLDNAPVKIEKYDPIL